MIKYISEFEKELSLRGLSLSTISEMKRDILLIFRYLPPDIKDISLEDLKSALIKLKQAHHLKNVSLNRKITSLRLFFQFLYKSGYININLAKNLSFAKRIKGVPNYLTREEMRKLLEVSGENFFHHVIIHTFYELGLRLSELINLKIEDVDSSFMRIRILGKGQKVRYVPFSQQLLEKFRKLVKTQNGYRRQGYLFLLPDGSPLGPAHLQHIIKDNAQKAGISKRISPKTLRHTHATHSLEAGVDVFTLQKNLGHADLSSTLIYTHISDFSFSQSHQKFLNHALLVLT